MNQGRDTPERRRFLCDCGRFVSVTAAQPDAWGRYDLRSHRDPRTGSWCPVRSAIEAAALRALADMVIAEYPDLPLAEIVATWGPNVSDEVLAFMCTVDGREWAP